MYFFQSNPIKGYLVRLLDYLNFTQVHSGCLKIYKKRAFLIRELFGFNAV